MFCCTPKLLYIIDTKQNICDFCYYYLLKISNGISVYRYSLNQFQFTWLIYSINSIGRRKAKLHIILFFFSLSIGYSALLPLHISYFFFFDTCHFSRSIYIRLFAYSNVYINVYIIIIICSVLYSRVCTQFGLHLIHYLILWVFFARSDTADCKL